MDTVLAEALVVFLGNSSKSKSSTAASTGEVILKKQDKRTDPTMGLGSQNYQSPW